MKYFLETTVWSDGSTKNGQYYLTDDKMYMVAYQAPGETEYKRFKSPIRIDKRGRTFKVIKDGESDSLYIVKTQPEAPLASAIQVAGSKGAVYHVTKRGENYSCTCSGFSFRRKCRHIDSVKAQ